MKLAFRSFLPLIAVLLFACAADYGAYPDATNSSTASCRKVEMYGDSITHQAGQTIEEFLPCYTVVNLGLDGQKASDATNGRYGNMPTFNRNTIYTFSWGVNEALNGFTDYEYEQAMNHVFNACKGFKCVIEAPWLMTNPQADAPSAVIRYREILRLLGLKYGVPVAALDMNQDHIGEGIHLPGAHMRLRAQLLAAAILKANL